MKIQVRQILVGTIRMDLEEEKDLAMEWFLQNGFRYSHTDWIHKERQGAFPNIIDSVVVGFDLVAYKEIRGKFESIDSNPKH